MIIFIMHMLHIQLTNVVFLYHMFTHNNLFYVMHTNMIPDPRPDPWTIQSMLDPMLNHA